MKKIRIAAMADLHMRQDKQGAFRQAFEEISQLADILLICGDLTENGLPEEAQALAQELNFCTVPVIGVLGNHDYTNNAQEEIKKILISKQMFILGEQHYTYGDIGFAGVKGFCGGFDNHITQAFGEPILKEFVYEAIKESIKLEETLTRMSTAKKVVLLHYSPIKETVEGEPLEIFPMMGTSRLAEPIDNFGVSMVFHGHVHHGSLMGKTNKGVPVYNVSLPVLLKIPPYKPYKIVEI